MKITLEIPDMTFGAILCSVEGRADGSFQLTTYPLDSNDLLDGNVIDLVKRKKEKDYARTTD